MLEIKICKFLETFAQIFDIVYIYMKVTRRIRIFDWFVRDDVTVAITIRN